jgi:two-component sensor histidine kinase
MMVHELISNAARHAFTSGKGSIRVELARTGTFVECRVLDDGSATASGQPGREVWGDDSNIALDRGVQYS